MQHVDADRVRLAIAVSTATEERTDVVELVVDLDDELKCNHPDSCDRAAEWVYYCGGCRDAWLACPWHRFKQDNHFATAPRWVTPVCRKCMTPIPRDIPWRVL